jgi:acyl-CoA reductase-like NAD-dependent aldehyde dehydrogenase
VREIAEDDKQSIDKKFSRLRGSQSAWQKINLSKRIDIIKQFSKLLERDIEKLAAILTSEVGKPLQQSRNEVNGARTRIAWLADNAEKYLSDEWMNIDSNPREKIVYEPLGVICNISAWNYPWLVGVNVFVPALLAGNAVMYKPSEYASLTGLEVERLLKEAGVPDDIFQVAIGAGNIGGALLDLPLMVIFLQAVIKPANIFMKGCRRKWFPVNANWEVRIPYTLRMI